MLSHTCNSCCGDRSYNTRTITASSHLFGVQVVHIALASTECIAREPTRTIRPVNLLAAIPQTCELELFLRQGSLRETAGTYIRSSEIDIRLRLERNLSR